MSLHLGDIVRGRQKECGKGVGFPLIRCGVLVSEPLIAPDVSSVSDIKSSVCGKKKGRYEHV